VHEAHDLTQAFFAEFLEKNYVGPAAAERGRFRAYLLTCFKHFLSHEWERARAKKRGGGRMPISLDFAAGDSKLTIEPSTDITPEQVYERQWAASLLDRVLERVRIQLSAVGKSGQFEVLKAFLIGPPEGHSYAEAAAKLGMTTAAAKMAASRMRRKYRELLREEIARTVASPDDIEREIQDLFEILGR
jgi:RNA polymerase sigma-70 factor (ECF subfamily)